MSGTEGGELLLKLRLLLLRQLTDIQQLEVHLMQILRNAIAQEGIF